jgi:hypothetical protein
LLDLESRHLKILTPTFFGESAVLKFKVSRRDDRLGGMGNRSGVFGIDGSGVKLI